SFNNDKFIFAGEDGTISGWRGALGTTAEKLWGPASAKTEYKGLAIGSVGANTYLYAADFGTNAIDVFPSSASSPALTGNFTDPNIPAGFAPFNIQNLNGNLYVTYAKVGPTGDDVAGLGNGFVDEFDLQGNLIRRVASQGWLNSPWGLAIAPNGFGKIGGDLLVGNFGDGHINVFSPTGAFLEQLTSSNGDAISVDGLWGLQFGNGGAGGLKDVLYFTAGLDDESHGLFGSFTPVPEPSTVYGGIALVLGSGFVMLRRRRQAKAVQ
ncbi:MAG TPA: TIGR03118 family protein, partial [Opitutaceae bacterium]